MLNQLCIYLFFVDTKINRWKIGGEIHTYIGTSKKIDTNIFLYTAINIYIFLIYEILLVKLR